jgi:hypothetical protein
MKPRPPAAIAPIYGFAKNAIQRISTSQAASLALGESSRNRGGIAMSRELVTTHNKPVFDQLHPRVYGTAVGLIAWFALMAWALFDRNSDVSLSLMFVTVLFVVAVALPWTLSLVWRKFQMPHERSQPLSFRDWRDGDFAVWGASLHGSHAAIDVLLPLIAVSLGLTAIGIVFVIVRAFAV